MNLVDTDKIIKSDKCKLKDEVSKYYISWKDDTIGPLCIVLPQMSEYKKNFNNRRRDISFVTEDVVYW